jgi:hypothetical protein
VCESILIGVSAAYWMVNGFWSTLVPNLFGKLMPSVVREYAIPSLPVSDTPGFDMALAFVPLALGLMLLWRLAPKGGWISVWPLAFIIGTTAGIRLVASIEADLLAQASGGEDRREASVTALEEGIDEVEDRCDGRGANVLVAGHRPREVGPSRAQGGGHEGVVLPGAQAAERPTGLSGEVGE